ncbi:MAG: leucyl aminopeptidase family protein [Fibrobacterota bacterium]
MSLTIKIISAPVHRIPADTLVALLTDPRLFDEAPFREPLARLKKGYANGTLATESLRPLPNRFIAKTLYVHSTDAYKRTARHEQSATALSAAVAFLAERGHTRIALLCDRGADRLPQILRGLLLGAYVFDRYKQKKNPKPAVQVLIAVAEKDLTRARRTLAEETAMLACVNECRDAVNAPANAATTDDLARRARKVAKETRAKITVLEKPALARLGYNGLLTVGASGHTPPRMIVLEYRPRTAAGKGHLCLVGKGIAFDSGGLCLKPPADMWTMKDDMAGAAAVLYAFKAAVLRKPRKRLSAVLCLAENMPGSRAVRPGDIFRAANGKHVHVENTDAEGRLILTDGLHMAGRLQATHIVDAATLTGACVVALGERIAGLMGTDAKWVESVRATAEASAETVCVLPLFEEYRSLLDTPVADINNVSPVRWGGAITAGLFLKEFVPTGTAWAHLDIAGPAFSQKKWNYLREGATGFGVRTLAATALCFNG